MSPIRRLFGRRRYTQHGHHFKGDHLKGDLFKRRLHSVMVDFCDGHSNAVVGHSLGPRGQKVMARVEGLDNGPRPFGNGDAVRCIVAMVRCLRIGSILKEHSNQFQVIQSRRDMECRVPGPTVLCIDQVLRGYKRSDHSWCDLMVRGHHTEWFQSNQATGRWRAKQIALSVRSPNGNIPVIPPPAARK